MVVAKIISRAMLLAVGDMGGNVGLSLAYNVAWKYASEHGYDYLMTMDQDSRWVDLETYVGQIKSHESITQFNSVYFASTSAGNNVPFTPIDSGGINSGAVIPIRFWIKLEVIIPISLLMPLMIGLCWRRQSITWNVCL